MNPGGSGTADQLAGYADEADSQTIDHHTENHRGAKQEQLLGQAATEQVSETGGKGRERDQGLEPTARQGDLEGVVLHLNDRAELRDLASRYLQTERCYPRRDH